MVNSAFLDFASLDLEHSELDSYHINELFEAN